ncbi:hypothetical protein F5Y16DRAFT_376886 [Xylariaceae sp. FL0255]|nr:hypothetical protein F5Y16DRAFT_376886 [Xylariaceae sp. FL0255]
MILGFGSAYLAFLLASFNTPAVSANLNNGLVGAVTMSLGDVVNMTYNVVPPGFDSGIGVVTMPDNCSITFTVAGGEAVLIFATDTAAVSKLGYGGLLTMNGSIPEYKILYYDKLCGAIEYMEI